MKKFKVSFNNFSSSNLMKIVVLTVLFLLLITLVFSDKRPYKVKLHVGDISLNDVYAPYEFTYPGDIDESKMEVLKKEALENFLPFYDIKPNYWEEKRDYLSKFFGRLKEIKDMKNFDDNLLVEKFKKDMAIKLEDSVILPFFQSEQDLLEETAMKALDKLSSKIIAGETTINELTMSRKEEIIVHDKNLDVEAEIPRSDLYTSVQLKPLIEETLSSQGIESDGLKASFTAVISDILSPNLEYNQSETELRRKDMLDQIPPVYKQILVKKDELIIAKGQKVTKNHIDKLSQLARKDTGRGRIGYLGGIIILLITFVVMIPVYLHTYRKNILNDINNLYLLSILLLLSVFLAKVIIASPLPSYFIPLAASTMLMAILIDTGISFMLAIMLSVFAAVIAGNKFDLMIVLMIGSTAGIY
ncbi:MAG: hypothetical protein JW800_02905, partial [Candidatus Omnitrophica bacterium]|nr:hypothetical protein [Candidatus Omnitrophota bacterium]